MGQSVNSAESVFNRLDHQIADHIAADTPGCGDMAHDLTIATVETESHPHAFHIPTRNFKYI
jgi:hypothetical protein